MTTNTVTLLRSSQDALSVLNELNSVPDTVESVYYRLSDPFWPLSSEADMSSIVKEACSQLPLLRYSKSNAPKGYSVNGLELSEPTDRVLNVYTDVPQSISTDTVLILPLNTVIAERELINTLCSKGNCTVYSPYIKMGEWSASDVLSKSYLFILIQGVQEVVDNINNVYDVIDSVVNGIIKRINTQLYTVTLLSERYANVKESPNFTEYFNCQNGIVQAHREFLDSVK
jgi:hypothetical protein